MADSLQARNGLAVGTKRSAIDEFTNGGGSSKRPKLLNDSDSDSSSSDDDDESEEEVPDTNGFKINTEYAKRFEHNKKREEKQRCQYCNCVRYCAMLIAV